MRLMLLICTFCITLSALMVVVSPRPLSIEINQRERESRLNHAVSHTYRLESPFGIGSGVALDENTLLTNWHVVENLDPGELIVTLNDEAYTVVEIVRIPNVDAAYVEILGVLTAPEIRTEPIEAGEWVTMSGHLQGMRHPSATEGAIIGRYWPGHNFMVDGAIIPGMSGGGVFDTEGRLIGINVATTVGPGRAVGIIIPLDRILKEIDALEHTLPRGAGDTEG